MIKVIKVKLNYQESAELSSQIRLIKFSGMLVEQMHVGPATTQCLLNKNCADIIHPGGLVTFWENSIKSKSDVSHG